MSTNLSTVEGEKLSLIILNWLIAGLLISFSISSLITLG